MFTDDKAWVGGGVQEAGGEGCEKGYEGMRSIKEDRNRGGGVNVWVGLVQLRQGTLGFCKAA